MSWFPADRPCSSTSTQKPPVTVPMTVRSSLPDRLQTQKPENGQAVCELFNPGKPISIDAMAIHHITEKMVADKPPFMGSEACDKLRNWSATRKTLSLPTTPIRHDHATLGGYFFHPDNLHAQAGPVSGQERCHPQIQPPVSPLFSGPGNRSHGSRCPWGHPGTWKACLVD
jgi:hypothetical protein